MGSWHIGYLAIFLCVSRKNEISSLQVFGCVVYLVLRFKRRRMYWPTMLTRLINLSFLTTLYEMGHVDVVFSLYPAPRTCLFLWNRMYPELEVNLNASLRCRKDSASNTSARMQSHACA